MPGPLPHLFLLLDFPLAQRSGQSHQRDPGPFDLLYQSAKCAHYRQPCQ